MRRKGDRRVEQVELERDLRREQRRPVGVIQPGSLRPRVFVVAILAVAVLAASCSSSTLSTHNGVASRSTPTRNTSALGVEPPPPIVPHPFAKLNCSPLYGIRFCKGGFVNGRDLRVPSFDGVPLSADLALPPTGRGPFPLLVLLHGFGESKAEFETSVNDGSLDDVTMASQGWAVLMYTARGFGSSCGTPASRAGTPACSKGWIQLADQRYEIRDTQYLAGELVDEGLVKPNIAVAGVSYGAGQSLELATLKNRMRLTNGKLVPFVSPRLHVPMSVAGAYAMWPWEDLVTALAPNGHLATASYTPAASDISPFGVAKQSWVKLLYAVAKGAYLSPPGVDPQTDLTTWYHEFMAGEPYSALDAHALSILQKYKSSIGIPLPPGGPAPTAIQSGWTDSLFPVSEALHYANRINAAGDHTTLLMMFDDVGHGWAQDKPADTAYTNKAGIAFLNAVVRGLGRPLTGVAVIPQTCPKTAPSGPPVTGPSLSALQHGRLVLNGPRPQTVTSNGGNPTTSQALNPAGSAPLCNPLPPSSAPGTAIYNRQVGKHSVTLLGAVSVSAKLHITGNYPELVARLWDVSPGGTRQIVAMGIYRPTANQRASTNPRSVANEDVTFQLNPNEYTFAAAHNIQLQLVGSNAPYFRKSNGTFTIGVSNLTASIPLR
ncbi:MAG: alpha/beta fold hydrolase [Acidimicrobiales bacterium]